MFYAYQSLLELLVFNRSGREVPEMPCPQSILPELRELLSQCSIRVVEGLVSEENFLSVASSMRKALAIPCRWHESMFQNIGMATKRQF